MDAAFDLCVDHGECYVNTEQLVLRRPCGMPGAKLTELICKGMRKLFTLHRKLLKNNQEYQGRTRDPPRVNLAGVLWCL